MEIAEDGQCYGSVSKRLGDGRFEVRCADGVDRLARVRGKLWKRQWIAPGDVVLVCLRAWQDARADVVHKYTDDEARSLVGLGEIPSALAGEARESAAIEATDDSLFGFANEEDLTGEP